MDELTLLINCKLSLQTLPKKNRTAHFDKILKDINHFIENRCEHRWIVDSIDIDPDRSRSVCYCEYCFTTR